MVPKKKKKGLYPDLGVIPTKIHIFKDSNGLLDF